MWLVGAVTFIYVLHTFFHKKSQGRIQSLSMLVCDDAVAEWGRDGRVSKEKSLGGRGCHGVVT